MSHAKFRGGKNDFFFAFVVAAMFAVTVVGAVAGVLDLARGYEDVILTVTHDAPAFAAVAASAGKPAVAPLGAEAGPLNVAWDANCRGRVREW